MKTSVPPLPPRPAELQAGVSLIVAVLGISFFLLIIIGVSLSLSVNSRQTVINSGQVLAAQYAAENAATQAQTRLQVAAELVPNLRVPRTETTPSMYAKVITMCAQSLSMSWNDFSLAQVDPLSQAWAPRRDAQGNEVYRRVGKVLCNFTPGQALNSVSMLSDLNFYATPQETGAQVVARITGQTNPTQATLTQFWEGVFSGGSATLNTAGAAASYGLQPEQLVRLGLDHYRLILRPVGITAQGSAQGSQRRLNMSGNNTLYFIDIRRDGFSRYALFTDHHYASRDGEGSDQRIFFTGNTNFTGPVHTNQTFNFAAQVGDNGQSATFRGRVTSAGCARNQLTNDGCNGFNRGATFRRDGTSTNVFHNAASLASTTGTLLGTATDIAAGLLRRENIYATMTQGADFQAQHVPLPPNINDQFALARNLDFLQGTGLSFNGDVDRMELHAVSLNNRTFQQIRAWQGSTDPTTAPTVNLLIDDQKRVYLCRPGRLGNNQVLRRGEQFYDGTNNSNTTCTWVLATKTVTGGAWVEAPANVTAQTFNGVVHVERDVRWLGGPARTSQPAANQEAVVGQHVNPAIAAHAQITIAANRDINIYRDLRYQDDPRSNAEARNVLGLFSAGINGTGQEATPNRQDAFINLMADTGVPDSNRRICTNLSCTTNRTQTAAQQSTGGTADGPGYVQTDPAPDDLTIDASMMASQGAVRVVGHNRTGLYKNQMHLLGGIIQQYYGLFGTFGTAQQCVEQATTPAGYQNGRPYYRNPYTGNLQWDQCIRYVTVGTNTGYGRNFRYDERFEQGLTPPGFPTQPIWESSTGVAATSEAGAPQNVPASFADVGFWRQVGQ